MTLHRTLVAALAAAALAAGLSFQAAAQTELPSASDITDEQLESFAAATVEIRAVAAEWSPQIQAAQTPEEQAALNAQAEAEMVQVVEDHGLSVEAYTSYVQLAQADPSFMERVRAEIASQ